MSLGLLGIAGSVIGGISSARAASRGANAQLQAAQESNALQREIYYQNRDDLAPWRNTGANALAQMAYEMGIGPNPAAASAATLPTIEETPGDNAVYNEAGELLSGMTYNVGDQSFASRENAQAYIDGLPAPVAPSTSDNGDRFARFRQTPGYQFGLEEGQNALARMSSARGTRLGSNTLREALRYGQGMADQNYGNYYNRLASIAGTGQTATNTTAGLGSNYASAVGANNAAGAQAQASGYMGQSNALNGTINGIFSTVGAAQGGAFGSNPWSFNLFQNNNSGGYNSFPA